MGDLMNATQLERFDRCFDEHYLAILAEIATSDPSGAARRTRAAFASAYRFWSKVEDDGNPIDWIHRVITDDRRAATRHRTDTERFDEPGHRTPIDLDAERRSVVALARRQRAIAGTIIGTSALATLGAELFVAHR